MQAAQSASASDGRGMPATTSGQETLRELMFGADHGAGLDAAHFDAALSRSRALIADRLTALELEVAQQGDLDSPLLESIVASLEETMSGLGSLFAEHDGRARGRGAHRPLRVLLMGRTMAGKSTLLEALTSGDGSRRGDGRQRYSRDVEERPVRFCTDMVLIDSPGVGALDGPEDYALAFAQVPNADLVVWVAANDATTEDTAAALRHITMLGKPVLLALNCRAAIPPGRRRDRFLERPDRAFEMSHGHLKRIGTIIEQAGGVAPRSFLVHAEAAYLATCDGDAAQALHEASRIQQLLDALVEELERHREQRQALADADSVRGPVDQSLAALEAVRSSTAEATRAHGQLTGSLESSWKRAIQRERERGEAALRRQVNARRDWAQLVDVESDIKAAWSKEAAALTDDINKELGLCAERTAKALAAVAEDLAQEWTLFGQPEELEPTTGKSSMWGNRLLKVVGRAGAPLLVGFLVGGPAGWIAAGVVALVIPFLDGFINWLFSSRDEVIRRRRKEIEEKLGPVLDSFQARALQALSEQLDLAATSASAVVEDRRAAESRAAAMLDVLGREIDIIAADLPTVDAVTAARLATLAGRGRLAGGVRAGHRVPGRLILVEVDEGPLTENTLFPDAGTVERLIAIPASGPGHRSALYALLGVVPGGLSLGRITPDDVSARPVADMPLGVREVLSSTITQATGTATTIEGE